MSNTHPPSPHQERLRHLVQISGVTSDRLSILAGLSQAHVGMLVRGDIKTMRTDTARAIASVTGCSLDWLLAGTGAGPSQETVHACMAKALTDRDALATAPTLPAPTSEVA